MSEGGFFFVNIMIIYQPIMFVINKKYLVFIGGVLVVGLIIFVNKIFIKPEPTPVVNSNVIDANNNSLNNGSAIVKNNPVLPVKNYPRYTGRPLNEVRLGTGFSAPQEYIEKQKKDLVLLASVLNKNPVGIGGVDDWIAVGIIKKSFNDYEGTRDAWEYAGVLYPNNALSFANLGSLYGFYLHDNEKAELNFIKAIDNDPYQPSYYLSLADFYKEVDISKKNKIPEVILSGLSKMKDANLYLYLATYYRDVGDKVNALKYYQEVLNMEPNQAGIQDEINRLK